MEKVLTIYTQLPIQKVKMFQEIHNILHIHSHILNIKKLDMIDRSEKILLFSIFF